MPPQIRSPWSRGSGYARQFVLTVISLAIADQLAAQPDQWAGPWMASLGCPGGDIRFQLELVPGQPQWSAFIVNGPERIEVPKVDLRGDELSLAFPHYDSEIRAALTSKGSLEGTWRKRRGKDSIAELEFAAQRVSQVALRHGAPDRYQGRWRVTFASDSEPAIGIFRTSSNGQLWGTFLTTTGDYRYLGSSFDNDTLLLSCFDGSHAFLFSVVSGPEGTLRGDFWSGDWWHDTWTGVKDPTAKLPDAFAQSSPNSQARLEDVVFRDLDGNPVSLADPQFAGKARIIEVFGSWCPNCHDAAPLLQRLKDRFGPSGLSILGVAFELTGDFERDARQVATYVQRHKIQYPVLIAGVSDKEKASAAMPLLDRIRAYPTLLFLDRSGRVVDVYTGFTGPAAGAEHEHQNRRIERVVQELLADPE